MRYSLVNLSILQGKSNLLLTEVCFKDCIVHSYPNNIESENYAAAMLHYILTYIHEIALQIKPFTVLVCRVGETYTALYLSVMFFAPLPFGGA